MFDFYFNYAFGIVCYKVDLDILMHAAFFPNTVTICLEVMIRIHIPNVTRAKQEGNKNQFQMWEEIKPRELIPKEKPTQSSRYWKPNPLEPGSRGGMRGKTHQPDRLRTSQNHR